MNLPPLDDVSIAIITPLPKEFNAACAVFGCGDAPHYHTPTQKHPIHFCEVSALHDKVHIVAITWLMDAGNVDAATVTNELCNSFENLKAVIVCGIAGAVPNPNDVERHVRLGDLVMSGSAGVTDYGRGKQRENSFEIRSPLSSPSSRLLRAANTLKTHTERSPCLWERLMREAVTQVPARYERPGDERDVLCVDGSKVEHPVDSDRANGVPKLFIGSIASSNEVQANEKRRDWLRDEIDARAVEMEGAGVASAAHGAEREYFIVRGTCDYCNDDKNDMWQDYAAFIAAIFTKSLLHQTPPWFSPGVNTYSRESLVSGQSAILRSIGAIKNLFTVVGKRTQERTSFTGSSAASSDELERKIADRLKDRDSSDLVVSVRDRLVQDINNAIRIPDSAQLFKARDALEELVTEQDERFRELDWTEAYEALANAELSDNERARRTGETYDSDKLRHWIDKIKRFTK